MHFVEDVFSLGYKDEPDYSKLKFRLVKVLLDNEWVPNHEFDWNRDRNIETSLNKLENASQISDESRMELLVRVDELEQSQDEGVSAVI